MGQSSRPDGSFWWGSAGWSGLLRWEGGLVEGKKEVGLVLCVSRVPTVMGLTQDMVYCRNGANNSAMFSELVPVNLRSTVYAFDRCFGKLRTVFQPLSGLIPAEWQTLCVICPTQFSPQELCCSFLVTCHMPVGKRLK